MIALDTATRDNGCLQVLRGSHRLGRLDHGPVVDGAFASGNTQTASDRRPAKSAQQHGADPQRVERAQVAGCERLHCELDPGDAIFFHCNTLVREHQHPCTHPTSLTCVFVGAVHFVRCSTVQTKLGLEATRVGL